MLKAFVMTYLVIAYFLTLIIWLFTIKEVQRADTKFGWKDYTFFTIVMLLIGSVIPILIVWSYIAGTTLPGEDDGKKDEKETK